MTAAVDSAHSLEQVSQPARRGWRRTLRPLIRNKLVLAGVLLALALVLVAVFANSLAPYDPLTMDMGAALTGPSGQHLLGTDRFGRDVFSRVIHGSRTSLWVGITAMMLSLTIGSTLGLASGYFGGSTDNAICRVMDVFFSFPALLLAIAIAAMLGPGMRNVLVAIAVVYAPLFSRVVRATTLSEKHKEYVDAARVIGASDLRVIRRHILPNTLSPIIVQASITLSHAILIESYLSFLGLGTQPPHPSWGNMLSEGRKFLETAPWISIFPGVAIMLSVLAFNLLGDGLRDVLDPQSASRL